MRNLSPLYYASKWRGVGWGSRSDPHLSLAWGSIDVGFEVGWGGARESIGASAKTINASAKTDF